jgi:hypothetical protein
VTEETSTLTFRHAGRNVHVDADILILELRIDERIDEARSRCRADADTGLKAACGDRHAVADLEFGDLPVNRTDLWILNDFGCRVRQQSVGREAGQGDAVVRTGQMT